jgi:nucleotide-binding universal stress UspA family protein
MKLLVAVDGSPASLRAVNMAIEFAGGRQSASVILLTVQNPTVLGPDTGLMLAAWTEEEEERAGEEALKEAVAKCQAAGIQFTTRNERGVPAGIQFTTRNERGVPAVMIDQVARQENVDHIIMGSRGLGSVRGLLVGSVATKVLHLVNVPVTIVK